MICDKCVKKDVCKICDGSNIQGCIAFYRPHKEILQEIKREIECKQSMDYQRNRKPYNKCLEIVDNHISGKEQ